MNVLALTVLVHIFAKHGMMWDGATAAWILAVIMDVALYAWLIYCIFKPFSGGQ